MSFIHRILLLTVALFLGTGPMQAAIGGFSAVYDLDGNRTRKTAEGVTAHYLVATVNPTGWPQVVEEHTGTSPGIVTRRYTYGADLISQSRKNSSSWDTDFFLTDGLGSTRALLSSDGSISDTYTYDAFGNQTRSSMCFRLDARKPSAACSSRVWARASSGAGWPPGNL